MMINFFLGGGLCGGGNKIFVISSCFEDILILRAKIDERIQILRFGGWATALYLISSSEGEDI